MPRKSARPASLETKVPKNRRTTIAGTPLAQGKSLLIRWQAVCVASKGKNRKDNNKSEQPEAAHPETEQSSSQGMSDEIVRDFLVESPAQSQPAGEQPRRCQPRRRRLRFCPGPDRQSGHPQRYRQGSQPSQPPRLPQVVPLLVSEFLVASPSASASSVCGFSYSSNRLSRFHSPTTHGTRFRGRLAWPCSSIRVLF